MTVLKNKAQQLLTWWLSRINPKWMRRLRSLTTRNSGEYFEHVAERWLCAQGLELVERNYRCRRGEIDLIMFQGETLVFIEVRYRRTHSYGGAASSVVRSKQLKIIETARHYLQQHAINEARQACRFDVIAIDGDQLEWLRSAF